MSDASNKDRTSALEGQAIVVFGGQATARLKSGLAVHHMLAAKFFSKQAIQLEDSLPSPTEAQRSEHRAYVLGTIFTATAFLEALINEYRPFQGTDLVYLRNSITHYKPEWDDELRKHANIATRLQGQFPDNRFALTNQTFFPHRCQVQAAQRGPCQHP